MDRLVNPVPNPIPNRQPYQYRHAVAGEPMLGTQVLRRLSNRQSPITLTEPVNLTIQSGLKLANLAKKLTIQGGTELVMVGDWKARLPIIPIEVRNVKST